MAKKPTSTAELDSLALTEAGTLESRTQMRRVAFASAIGNAIEYYDFSLYAVASSLVFNVVFFPSGNALVGTLLAFVTFFVGYCARPIGGIIFGHYGDRIGRKKILLLTMIIMGAGTFIIGLVPSYDTIGILAPIALVILRLVQGIGIGGEYGGGMTMTIEHAPANKRGFYSSLVHIGVPAGLVLPVIFLGALSALPKADFLAWGWRIPFIASIILVAIGFFIRYRITESPAFAAVKEAGDTAKLPVIEALRDHWRSILLGIGSKVAESGLFNIYAVFAITFCVSTLKLPQQEILNGVLIGAVLECITLPLFGALSDRIGRRKVYIGGLLFQAVLALPFFAMLSSGNHVLIYAAIALGLAVGHGSVYGAQGAFFSELFPARVRYSGLSLVQQLGPILGGGLSPLIAATLLAQYGTSNAVMAYMIIIAVISAGCAYALRPIKTMTPID
ncbi:MFS transporter [Arthrobacter sp. M4]|uniref:MFS transporter n=1 Tax=Arthrobacter sp. M4 TaxID=218160 RepID=UPI001CDB5734|nr:MFS transporter [Arthrobacter sp. M4]MCA4131796.1 MHS family MFS transporter [Arthrobacter sp. M4]